VIVFEICHMGVWALLHSCAEQGLTINKILYISN